MRKLVKEAVDLFGPHELVALALFLAVMAVWCVTLSRF
jgi:hypothetical protein